MQNESDVNGILRVQMEASTEDISSIFRLPLKGRKRPEIFRGEWGKLAGF